MVANPCLSCGEPTRNGSRCEACGQQVARIGARGKRKRSRGSAASRGYDTAWERLSRKARRLQPFCSDCGATEDLQADHSPEAWERHAKGLPIRLRDIDVVCGPCNRKRGAARGKHARSDSKALKNQDGSRVHHA